MYVFKPRCWYRFVRLNYPKTIDCIVIWLEPSEYPSKERTWRTKWPLVPTQGDRPIRSSGLSNRHVSLWPLGPPVLAQRTMPSKERTWRTKWPLVPTQGDRPIRSSGLSNRHVSLWPLGLPVLAQRTMRDTHPCWLRVLGWGGWAHGATLFLAAHAFVRKNGPGPVYETLPLDHRLFPTLPKASGEVALLTLESCRLTFLQG